MTALARPTFDLPPLRWPILGAALLVTMAAGAVVPFIAPDVLGIAGFIGPIVVALATIVAGPKRVAILVGAAAFVVVLHVSYVTLIPPTYDYARLSYLDPSTDALAIAAVLAWLPAMFLPLRATRPSDAFAWIIYLAVYVPASLVPTYVLDGAPESTLPLNLTLLLAMSILLVVGRLPMRPVVLPALAPATYRRLLTILAVGCWGFLLLTFGITFSLPSLDNAYDARTSYTAALGGVRAIQGYIASWAGYVVFPMLLAIGINQRRYIAAFGGLLGLLYIYSVTGLKAEALLWLPLVAVFVIVRRRPAALGTAMVSGVTLLVGICSLLALAGLTTTPLDLIVRRTFAVPGALTGFYYDFFSTHQTYGLSQSVLSFLGPAQYPVAPPYLIGQFYFGTSFAADANFWADAMANFGLPGIVVFTLALAAMLRFLDRVTMSRSPAFVFPVVALMALVVSSAALLTSLMTFGGILMGILLILSPGDDADVMRGNVIRTGAPMRSTPNPALRVAYTPRQESGPS